MLGRWIEGTIWSCGLLSIVFIQEDRKVLGMVVAVAAVAAEVAVVAAVAAVVA